MTQKAKERERGKKWRMGRERRREKRGWGEMGRINRVRKGGTEGTDRPRTEYTYPRQHKANRIISRK